MFVIYIDFIKVFKGNYGNILISLNTLYNNAKLNISVCSVSQKLSVLYPALSYGGGLNDISRLLPSLFFMIGN